jgi:hypothetical protein
MLSVEAGRRGVKRGWRRARRERDGGIIHPRGTLLEIFQPRWRLAFQGPSDDGLKAALPLKTSSIALTQVIFKLCEYHSAQAS